jgi:radical SAM superfamily enzyme YgiQ (UPF0313 family)
MKILLMTPPCWSEWKDNFGPPLGLGYIAAVLEKNGYDVKIIDPNPLKLTIDNLLMQIKKENPTIVGISCISANRFEAFELAENIKKEMPEVMIVMGGTHVTFLAKQILDRIPQIDIIVRGEGEITMLDLVRSTETDKNFHNVKGISFRENGEIITNPDRPYIENLDSLPFPAFHLMPLDKYFLSTDCKKEIKSLKHCTMVASRGCLMSCVFCSTSVFWGKKFRARSPENVLDEIEYLIKNYGIEHIQFFDDSFAMNPKRAKKICQGIIDRGYNIKFIIMGRVDTMDDELILLLKKAGCHRIDFGLETGSDEIMKNINKKIKLPNVERTFKKCKEAGIEVRAFIMMSLPGEREDDVKMTIDFVKKIHIDYMTTAITSLNPGSELYNRAKSNGMVDDNIWFNYKSPATEITTKDMPPYLEYFSMDDLNYYCKLINYEGWKKKGMLFYSKKVLRKLSDPVKIVEFLKRKISS